MVKVIPSPLIYFPLFYLATKKTNLASRIFRHFLRKSSSCLHTRVCASVTHICVRTHTEVYGILGPAREWRRLAWPISFKFFRIDNLKVNMGKWDPNCVDKVTVVTILSNKCAFFTSRLKDLLYIYFLNKIFLFVNCF